MPQETQELQLRVTLDDQASLGLDRLKDDLKQLSTIGSDNLRRMKQENDELAKRIKEIGEIGERGIKGITDYIGKFGLAGAAFAGFAGILAVGMHSLKEFADKMVDLTNRAKVMNVDTATLKNIIEQYERVGVSAAQTQENMANLSEVLGSLGKFGSEQRDKMIAAAGAYGLEMDRAIKSVLALNSREEQVMEIRRQAQQVYDNEYERTQHNDNLAHAAMLRYLALWKQDPSIMTLNNMEKVSEERKKVIEQREKAAAEFHKNYTELGQEMENLFDSLKAGLLSSEGLVNQGLRTSIELTKELQSLWDQPGKAATGLGAEGTPPTPNFNDRFGNWGAPQPFVGGGTAGGDLLPPTGGAEWWQKFPRSTHIEDRRKNDPTMGGAVGDYVKSLNANTTETKRLNDNFRLLDEGTAELKGFGMAPGFSGGPRGGGPYGSGVGPGTGDGAGGSHPNAPGGGTEVKEGTPSPVSVDPNQGDRPYHYSGTVTINGQTYHYGTGGMLRGSTPYGTYPINIGKGDIGSVGQRVGSIATLGGLGGVIPDPKYPGHPRAGIQVHAGFSNDLDKLYSEGCFAIAPREWPAFKAQLLKEAQNGPLNLTIGRDGRATIFHPDSATGDRTVVDASGTKSVRTVKVQTSGKLTADINAPRGSDVKVEGGGAFDKTETNRTMPLQ
jgi:hypothetical protein